MSINLDDYAAARTTLDEAMGHFPAHADLLMLDANLLKKEGHLERALAACSRRADVDQPPHAGQRRGVHDALRRSVEPLRV